MSSPASNFAQSDLRFLLPLQNGQRVLVLGDSLPLIDALRADNVIVEQGSMNDAESSDAGLYGTALDGNLTYDAATMDHVFLILPPRLQLERWLCESTRVLKPRGWLLLGVHNAQHLQRLRFWKRKVAKHTGYRHAQVRLSLERQGLRLYAEYGVHDDLQRPEQLVPLEDPGISSYFFERVVAPGSRLSSLARHIVAPLVAVGLHRTLYADFAFVTCREG